MALGCRLLAAIASVALLASSACSEPSAVSKGDAPLVLERTIPLAGVAGRVDHLAIDPKRRILFVAELGNGSVDAIDLGSGRSIGRITGLKQPQGLAFIPDADELVVASGGDGSLRFYRGPDLTPAGLVQVGDDADNVRLDPATGHVVVGYGSGALAVIDPGRRVLLGTLALPGHPESFRLHGDKAYVNVPGAKRIVVGDLRSGRVTASWTTPHFMNFPMALSTAGDEVTVVFRLRTHLVTFDAASGMVKADIETCGDSDDLFFDTSRRRFYVTCGSGSVDVVGVSPAGFSRIARIATRGGARTSLFVPELDRLFVAARAGSGSQGAAILVYRPSP